MGQRCAGRGSDNEGFDQESQFFKKRTISMKSLGGIHERLVKVRPADVREAIPRGKQDFEPRLIPFANYRDCLGENGRLRGKEN